MQGSLFLPYFICFVKILLLCNPVLDPVSVVSISIILTPVLNYWHFS